MSIEITTAFVQQYRSNVIHLAQQRGSRLWNFVQLKDNVVGKSEFFERIGKSEMRDVVSRHDDTPQMDTPHSRRMATMVTSDWADLIDKRDNIRILLDPTSAYSLSAGMAVGRRKDKHIVDAAIGNSYGGETGATAIPLPATQKISANSFGLTFQKLLDTKEIFDANEMGGDEGDPNKRIFIYSSRQLNELLGDTKMTSVDYNAIKALIKGEINEYLGFTFVRVEPRKGAPSAGTASGDNKHGLPYNQSTDVTTCIAFYGPSIALAIGQMETFRVSERDDKRYSTQVYVEMDIGSTRVEEEGVVLIDCDNSPAI